MSRLPPFPKRSLVATLERTDLSRDGLARGTYRFTRCVVNAKFSRLYWQNQKSVL